MKLNALLERAELLPRSDLPKAEQIAKQMVKAVVGRYGEDAEHEVKAKQMASMFHKEMLKAIDDELKHHKMKKVSPHDKVDVRA